MIKRFLYNILENDRSRYFILYQSFSFTFLMLSITFGIYDEIKGFQTELHPLISRFEYIVSGIIAFEYAGRFILSKNKLEYLIHPLSIIDLIAIIPFFQPFRILRFVVIIARFLRIAYRYRYFAMGIAYIFRTISFEFYFILSFFTFFFLASLIIMFSLEYGAGNPNIKNLFDALYLVIITMTTVGYGDITPITWEGKVISMILGMSGLFIFSMSVATVSAGFFNYVQMVRTGMISLKDMKEHIVICGWNETAQVIIEHLRETKPEKDIVVITTQDLSSLKKEINGEFYFKRGDFGREEILLDAGVDKASIVIILAEKLEGYTEDSIDARTILTGMQVRDLNKDAVLILELLLRENAKLIKKRKIADFIIVGGELIGAIISKFAEEKLFGNLFSHLVEHTEIETVEWEKDMSVQEAEKLLEKKGYRIVGIIRENKTVFFPKLSHMLRKGDRIMIIRHYEK